MDEIIGKTAAVEQAMKALETGKKEDWPEQKNALYTKAVASMLIALYQQNEEMIAQNKTMIQQNSDIVTALKRIINLG